MAVGEVFSWTDSILGLFFALVIHFFASEWLRTSGERSVLLAALRFKFAASLAYSLYVLYVYRGGDTLIYREAGLEYASVIWDILLDRPLPDQYTSFCAKYAALATANLCKLSGLVHLFSLDSFVASSFFFALIGFAGQALLYLAFVQLYPAPELRQWWRVGLLYFPSLTFWSAGMLKEPLALWGVGCVIWGIHYWPRRPSLLHLSAIAVGFLTLFLFRPEAALVLGAASGLWLVSAPYVRPPSDRARDFSKGLRHTLFIVAMMAVIGMGIVQTFYPAYSFAEIPQRIVGLSKAYMLNDTTSVAPLTADASWLGLLRVWPAALVFTLFRPFIWEANNIVAIAAAAENMLLLVISFRAGVLLVDTPAVLRRCLRSPLFLTCVAFVALFGLAVGVSTPNFGSVSRYRIPLIPFVVATLTIVEHHSLHLRREAKLQLMKTCVLA